MLDRQPVTRQNTRGRTNLFSPDEFLIKLKESRCDGIGSISTRLGFLMIQKRSHCGCLHALNWFQDRINNLTLLV